MLCQESHHWIGVVGTLYLVTFIAQRKHQLNICGKQDEDSVELIYQSGSTDTGYNHKVEI